MIIRPPAVEPNSQLQLRLCRWAVAASLDRQFQLHRYFPLGLKILSRGHSANQTGSRRWALLYGILSGPCMI
jgi:hypothetical protein